jgi:hypothetical protein
MSHFCFRRDDTTDDAASAETAVISTKMHMWWAWMKIAATHVGDGRRERGGQATAALFESIERVRLSQEFAQSFSFSRELVGMLAVSRMSR